MFESEIKFMDEIFTPPDYSGSPLPQSPSQLHNVSETPTKKIGHIKIPMNAFMVWAQINRKLVASANPTLTNLEVSRLLGTAWNKMSEQERRPYIDKAKQLRAEHLEKYPEFKYQPRRRRRKNKPDAIKSPVIPLASPCNTQIMPNKVIPQNIMTYIPTPNMIPNHFYVPNNQMHIQPPPYPPSNPQLMYYASIESNPPHDPYPHQMANELPSIDSLMNSPDYNTSNNYFESKEFLNLDHNLVQL